MASCGIETIEIVRPVFRVPDDALFVDVDGVGAGHGPGGERNRVFLHDAGLGIELADLARFVTAEPEIALGVALHVMKSAASPGAIRIR